MIRWGKRLGLFILSIIIFYFFLLTLYNYYWVSFITDSYDDLNGETIGMDNPKLIKKLRTKFLVPPPVYSTKHEYHLSKPYELDPSMGQAEVVRKYFKNKKNGVFIECGAMDGETRSNTLYFERFLNWTGLLIEADPLNFAAMLQVNRQSWLSPTCLSVNPFPEIVSFKQNKNMGKISDNQAGMRLEGHVDVQCFPLYTYLLALNMTTVDYFSLDVEGVELDVLKTIPFDKVNIEVMSVEFIHVPEGQEALKSFMESKGYKVNATVTHPNWLANDFIFTKS